jgi:hypothetical protein
MWLEIVSHILENYFLPWLERADDDMQTSNSEKLADQRKISGLQN